MSDLSKKFESLEKSRIEAQRMLQSTGMEEEQIEFYISACASAIELARQNPSELSLKVASNFIEAAQDAAVLKFQADKNEELATIDQVTGLLNRTGIMDFADARISYAQRNEHSCAIIFMDLNKFKPINDTLGHKEGDNALRLVADKLKETFRKSDLISRIGGDEFVIVMMNDNPNHNFDDELAKLENLFDGGVIFQGSDGDKYPIGAAAGKVIVNEGETAESAIERADAIMYEKKVIAHRKLEEQQSAEHNLYLD